MESDPESCDWGAAEGGAEGAASGGAAGRDWPGEGEAEVFFFAVRRHDGRFPDLRKLYGIDVLPLTSSQVIFDVGGKGVSLAIANGIRRAAIDEMEGYALEAEFTNVGADKTASIIPEAVCRDIGSIPLCRAVAAGLVGRRFRVLVDNGGGPAGAGRAGALVGLRVHSGSIAAADGLPMPERLFNPTFRIADLDPNKVLDIREIRLVSGQGDARFNNFCRGTVVPLDIPRRSDDEIRRLDGAAADESGYTVPSTMANPRWHRVAGYVPATSGSVAEVRALFADACASIAGRLRRLQVAVEGRGGEGVAFGEEALEDGLRSGTLRAANETMTVAEILKRAVCDTFPEVSYAGHRIVAHENSLLVFEVRHTGPVAPLLGAAIEYALRILAALQRGFASAPAAPPAGYPHPLPPPDPALEGHES